MCGRFNLLATPDQVATLFDLASVPQLAPRYNIAPTQPVAAVRIGANNKREMTHFVWGLIPSWSKDTKFASRMINARSETVQDKPSFRAAFKRRRCIVPVSGFYEWQKVAGGKQPMNIRPKTNPIFPLAGLWEYWASADGSEIESCTLLTTGPNELMAQIHNRMPVILHPDDFELWLDPHAPLPAVKSLLKSYDSDQMHAYPVSRHVNKPANDDARCIAPLVQ